MSAIAANLIGGFGNKMQIWAHAKARAEQGGHELRTQPWCGEKIFTLDRHKFVRPDGSEQEVLSGYFMAQKDLIYTRADCRRWFKLRPAIEADLASKGYADDITHAHFRRGDFAGSGFPLISVRSVAAALTQYGFSGLFRPVSDDIPTKDPAYTGDIEFLPDFYRLMKAPVLFRANSSFSRWAGTLGHGRVFSPLMDGLVGGVENDNVPYVEGNWPTISKQHDFCTDLFLRE